jgi:hypothetical protein
MPDFMNFVHELAQQIAERAQTGMSFEDQVIAAANDDMVGFCERYLAEYDWAFNRDLHKMRLNAETLASVARLLAHGMIRQHEFDTGKAETFEQLDAQLSEKYRAKREAMRRPD